MYFDSGTSLWDMIKQFFTHILGNAVVYNKVWLQIQEGWADGNYPLLFGSVFEAWWSKLWFENLLYDPNNLNSAEPVETFDWKDYVPDFLKGYLAPSPSFHKTEHFQQ